MYFVDKKTRVITEAVKRHRTEFVEYNSDNKTRISNRLPTSVITYPANLVTRPLISVMSRKMQTAKQHKHNHSLIRTDSLIILNEAPFAHRQSRMQAYLSKIQNIRLAQKLLLAEASPLIRRSEQKRFYNQQSVYRARLRKSVRTPSQGFRRRNLSSGALPTLRQRGKSS